jgi:ribosomal protein L7/L12
MTHAPDRSEALEALAEVSLILLGRKVAMQTREVRLEPFKLLDIAEASIKEDNANIESDDPQFDLKLRQVARKLQAVKSLRVLAGVVEALPR